MCGVLVSLGAYVVAYVANYTWQRIRHRQTPEWRYQRAEFVIDQEKVSQFAVISGVITMIALVLGFFIWAFTDSLTLAVSWPAGLSFVAAFFIWDNGRKPKRPVDRPTYGQIRDKHGV